jgi:replicative superfamily II helicase
MRLSEWIGGIAYVSASRPTALIQHVVSLIPNGGGLVQIQRHSIENGETVLTGCERFKTSDAALQFITWNAYKCGDAKILVFVSARKKAVTTALALGYHILDRCHRENVPISTDLVEPRRTLISKLRGIPDLIREQVESLIEYGIFYHTAALESRHRHALEKAAVQPTIRLLVATSTLAAGVDIPNVGTVIVLDSFVWESRICQPLSIVSYTQMIEGAGRSEGLNGKSYLFEIPDQGKRGSVFESVSLLNIPEVKFQLQTSQDLPRVFLEC